MKLEEAREIAEKLVESARPFCARAEIAGSIRRCKPEVKDIEIVVVPKMEKVRTEETDLFETHVKIVAANVLHSQWAMADTCPITWIKPSATEIIKWSPKPDGKYWRGYLPEQDIKIDLFLSRPDNWGMIYLMRTGSAEFNVWLFTHAMKMGCRAAGGYLTRKGQKLTTPEEGDVFRHLRLGFVSPEERSGSRWG